MCDVDLSEMFLNFPLHDDVRPLAGVDLSLYQAGLTDASPYEAWNRCAMALTSSPYAACQAMTVLEGEILGNRRDPANVFRWDKVELNLPGQNGYDP